MTSGEAGTVRRGVRRAGWLSSVWLWAAVTSVLLVVSVVVSLGLGAADIHPSEVLSSITAHLGLTEPVLSPLRDGIIWELRLPRVLTAAAVGAGLAVCGAVMQALTRNPLADPYLLGLSSGASLGAVFVIVLGASLVLPVAAFAGALAALVVTLALASAAGGVTPTRTVLAGVAVSALAAALTSFVVFWSAQGDSYREILSWLLGSVGGANWTTVAVSVGALVVIGVPLCVTGRVLDAFAFGDDAAAALGVNVSGVRWGLLAATALLTGAMVSVSGSIGFIGLVLPHAVRLLVGSRHRELLPLAAIAGAIVLVWADTISRTVFEPRELPVGIVTAIIGAPVFALILARKRGVS